MSGMPTGKAMTMNAEYTKKVEYLEELQSTYMYNIEDGQMSFFKGRERDRKRNIGGSNMQANQSIISSHRIIFE